MSFLQSNLRTQVNYFSEIDQNNKINCILHFHSSFSFNFSHSAIMISYQNSSSQCMDFRRRGLLWKSVTILFSLMQNHHVLEIQTQQCLKSRTGLSRKSYFIFVLQVFPQKNANWTWKLQSDFHDFIKFSAKCQLLLMLFPTTSATLPSNYYVKMFGMK